MSKILQINDLVLRFYTYEGVVKALEGVNLYVKKGETLGVVGETGCGKTMTGLSVLNLIPPPGKIEGGQVIFQDTDRSLDLLKQKDSTLRKIRGKDISMIFQEPSSTLNPVYTVGDQISEVFLNHRRRELCKKILARMEKDGLEKRIYEKMLENPNSLLLRLLSKIPIIGSFGRLKAEIRKEVINLLDEMGLPDSERVFDMYPHELSGGMQQRVVIAMALACNPTLLAADEPTTSLDVTVEAQILDLIKKLKKEIESSVIYITHDMGVIAETCDRVAVMYAGVVCEIADVMEIFKNPLHPYTVALLESIPRPEKEFKSIIGTVPQLIEPPSGCRFHPRCSMAKEICPKATPKLIEAKKEHSVACHLFSEHSE